MARKLTLDFLKTEAASGLALALAAIAAVLAIGWGLQALQAAVDAALLQALGPA